MEKLTGLLNEATIVDMPMFCKIAVRYRLHLVLALIFFFFFFLYSFYSQPIIYAVNIPIKVATGHKVSTELSDLLPLDNANIVTLEELNITLSSSTFLKSYAEIATLDSNIDNLDFGNLQSRKSLPGSEIRKICNNDDLCIVNRLAPILRESFSIEMGPTSNRFKLTASAIESNTAHALAGFLVKAIELDRIKVRQYMVLKEIKSVASLIGESRSMMKTMGGFAALEEQEKLQNNIADLKERIRMLQYNSSVEVANETTLEAKVVEGNKAIKNDGTPENEYELFLKHKSRLSDIKVNLNNLTHVPEDKRSASDKLIIAQLLEEQERLLAILPSGEALKAMELKTTFKKKQQENSGSVEFDYSVSKSKISRLTEEYEISKEKLNRLVQMKLLNESKVDGMKSDLEFLKNLETKQMSLKLLNATMTSDLIFEDVNQQVEQFRKASFYKVLFFCFSITAFLYLFTLVVRYVMDDKIYGEEDIRMYLKDLDFVGEAPAFE